MDTIKAEIVSQALQLFRNSRLSGQYISIAKEDIKENMVILFPKQNKENIRNLVEKSIEMYCSLDQAMDKAGGATWDIDTMKKMTVIDLITTLSVNRIRFIYIKENIQESQEDYKQKLIEIETFTNEMIDEYKKLSKDDPQNITATFGLDIYKEIKEKINS